MPNVFAVFPPWNNNEVQGNARMRVGCVGPRNAMAVCGTLTPPSLIVDA